MHKKINLKDEKVALTSVETEDVYEANSDLE